MIIYIDLIIILNIMIDFFLLFFLNRLLKRNTTLKRIVISSILGGISTICFFYINSSLLLLMYKFITSIILVIICFKYEDFNYFKDNLLWLYILSVVLGGFLYLIIDHGNIGELKINIVILLILSPLFLLKYVKNFTKYKIEYSNYYETIICYDDKYIRATGFLDTGNSLKDPFFNRPIVLVNKDLIKDSVQTFLVPYQTVNNKGLLEVFKPKKMVVNNKVVKNVLVGITDVNINGIKIILNKEAL